MNQEKNPNSAKSLFPRIEWKAGNKTDSEAFVETKLEISPERASGTVLETLPKGMA